MNTFRLPRSLCVLAVVSLISAAALSAKAKSELLFICSKSRGICSSQFDLDKLSASSPAVALEVNNPQFLAVHPDHKYLYTLNTAKFGGKNGGAVTAISLDAASGKLGFINQQPSAGGGPTHLIVDRSGKNVLVANYGSGSIAVFPIQKDGSLAPASAKIQHHGSSVHPQRQEGPHAHFITVDPSNRYALVCDLGLDKVLVYKFDAATGSLQPNDPPFVAIQPGAGPRHLAFDSHNHCYVINELDSTLRAFNYDSHRGVLKEVQSISTLPEKFSGKNFPAEVAVHPSGKFVYGSNRGDDSIAVFSIARDGKVALVQHQSTIGKVPRHFEIEPTGEFLLAANQDSSNVVAFRIDQKTGRLAPTETKIEVDTPLCVKAIPFAVK